MRDKRTIDILAQQTNLQKVVAKSNTKNLENKTQAEREGEAAKNVATNFKSIPNTLMFLSNKIILPMKK